MRKYKVAILATFLGLTAQVPARAERIARQAGTSSAPFLKIGVGARPVGMGEAFVAVADDVNSLYWNPAGLTALNLPHFAVTHQQAYQGLSHQFFGYAQPLMLREGARWRRAPNRAAWGTSLTILSVAGDLERRPEEGAGALGQLTSPQGTFGATDMAFGAAFALERRSHSYGVGAKFIRQSIDNNTAHSGAVDLGWIRREVLPNLSIGASVLNLGYGLRFNQNRYSLPLTVKTGAAYQVKRYRSRLALDFSASRDDFPHLALGGEFGLWEYLYLRAGYRYRWYGNPLGTLSGFRTGIGFIYKNLNLDYAAAPFGELGISHRFSLGWRFDPVRRHAPPSEPVQTEQGPAKTETVVQDAPALPLPPQPAGPAVEASGMTPFVVRTALKTLSARGSDFLVEASAPSDNWELKKIEFRAPLPGGDGLSIAAGESASFAPLPEGYEALAVFALSVNTQASKRSVSLSFRLPTGDNPAVLGLFDGQWRELSSEIRRDQDQPLLRASSDRFPAAVALGLRK